MSMLTDEQAAKFVRSVKVMEEQVAAIAKRDGNMQSIDHRLELLGSKLDHHAEVMQAKLDDINSSTVKKTDCDECEAEWKRAIDHIDTAVGEKTADKVSKRDFGLVISTLAAVALVLIVILNLTNIAKAFGGIP